MKVDKGMCYENLIILIITSSIVSAAQPGIRSHVVYVIPQVDHKLSQTPVSTSVESQASDCAVKCMQISNCRAINFGPSGQCELLGSCVCDSTDNISPSPGFRYYDIEDDRLDERLHQMRNTSDCLDNGRCSPKCGRSIGTTCTIHAECMSVDLNSVCHNGFCSCSVGFAYNVTTSICQEDGVVITTTSTTITPTTTTAPTSTSTPSPTLSPNISSETASTTPQAVSTTAHVTNSSIQTSDPNTSATTPTGATSTPAAATTAPIANTTTQDSTTTAPTANTTTQATNTTATTPA